MSRTSPCRHNIIDTAEEDMSCRVRFSNFRKINNIIFNYSALPVADNIIGRY